ncbi:MAG: N-acetylmuramoyl-L-alanine amidase [Verrucomicrobiota bacterium]
MRTSLITKRPSLRRRAEAAPGRRQGWPLAALTVTLLLAGCSTPPAPSGGEFPSDVPAPLSVVRVPDVPFEPGPPPRSRLPPGVNATFPGGPTAPGPRVPVPSPAATTSLPVQRINGTDYVDAAMVFARFGLRAPGVAGGTRATFQGGGHRADLTGGEREMTLDGLKIYLGDPALLRARAFLVSRTDAEKLIGPLLSPAGLGVPTPALRIIVLDPGHGGADAGTVNATLGVFEKTFALDVAQRLKPLLEAKGYQVVLTRTDDRYIPLPERPALANRARADLFISIHFNSAAPSVQGTEIFTFAPQGQRSVESWAAGAKDDSEHMFDSSNRFDAWNAIAAHALHGAFLAGLGTADRGQKIRHLAVLRGLNCPGVLIEAAFLSHPAEAQRVATPAYRQRIAEGIAAGVATYAARLAALGP